jgi:non-specific serine/threonine protein kinase
LRAAEAVCGGAGLPVEEMREAVAGLVDKSVLVREEGAGPVRYRLLETVRHYGLDRLRAAGSTDRLTESELRGRHRDWYVDLAERFDADWAGPRQPEWTRLLRAEQANLRAALGHCLAAPEPTPAATRLAGALSYFWFGCGVVREGRHWLERALAGDPKPSRDRLRVLAAYSRVLAVQGDHAAAAQRAQECLDQARELDDPLYVARALNHLGLSMSLGGDPVAALPLLEAALDGYLKLGETHPETNFARAAMTPPLIACGQPARAAALLADGRASCRALGDRWRLGHILTASALAAEELGDVAQARTYAKECLRIHRELNDPVAVAGSLERLAWLAGADGEHERAARLLGAADRQWKAVGASVYGSGRWLRRHDECAVNARRVLGERVFAARFRRGAALSLDRAIDRALH